METLASGTATPANADNTALADTGNADAKPADANGDGSAPSVPEADTPAPKDKVQERFDKLTREKYDALREADLARYQVELFKSQLAEMDKSEKAQAAPADEFPTLEKFGYDEGKFNAAVAAHYSKLATEQARTVAQEQLEKERQRLSHEQSNKDWATKEAEFLKSKPDYAEKVRDNLNLQITQAMAEVIRASDIGTQVAYYLGENPEIAAAIAKLPPLTQAHQVGRIEAKLELAKAPAKPAVSQAPPPVNKVDAAESSSEKSPEDMIDSTPAQFNKWRAKYMKKR